MTRLVNGNCSGRSRSGIRAMPKGCEHPRDVSRKPSSEADLWPLPNCVIIRLISHLGFLAGLAPDAGCRRPIW